jgi:DNA polymerase elongation subunit (family B)
MSEFYTNFHTSRNNILLRGIRDGKPFKEIIPYKPYHFIKSKTPTDIKNLKGESLSRIDFDSMKDAKNFIEKYEEVENFEIYGFKKYGYTFISDTYKEMDFDYSKLSIVSWDIECKSDDGFPEPLYADKEITAISLRKGNKIIVLGTVNYKEHRDDIIYIKCKDEKDLLYKFIDVWRKLNPDIITGWNIEAFDIPYTINRIKRILGDDDAKQLSPWLQLHEHTRTDKYKNEYQTYTIVGIATIDLQDAYKKFSFKNQESFSLNHIAHVELGENKIDYSNFEDLNDLYDRDPQKFIEYNIHDTDLVHRINEKTGLIEQIVTLAYDSKVNYIDSFTSVLLWEVIISNHLKSENIMVPTNPKRNRKTRTNMGAFVKDPIVKKYKWVVSEDLDSLYPHLIMQYNISPETLYKHYGELLHEMPITKIINGELLENEKIKDLLLNHNCTYTPNGSFFKKDKRGFLPFLMDKMYANRKKYKKMMLEYKKQYEKTPTPELESLISKYNNLQMAMKICLNSAYGACSNEWFMFFSMELAEAITYAGQLSIQWIEVYLNRYLNKILNTSNKDYIIAMDTDSCYIELEELVNQIYKNKQPEITTIIDTIDKFVREGLDPEIDKSYVKLAEYVHAYDNMMHMKRESIADVGLWKAKKHYALNVYDKEGVRYKEPKIEIKGIKAVQSSTPAICRDVIKETIEIILRGTKEQLIDRVDSFEKEFRNASFEEIAKTSSVSDLDKYHDSVNIYTKGTPSHVKGALIYNRLLKDKNLEKKYLTIKNGNKIKTCYLTLPNSIKEEVLSVANRLPSELGLEKYIDYDKQYETQFFKTVNELSLIVGWDLRNTNSLEAFFM